MTGYGRRDFIKRSGQVLGSAFVGASLLGCQNGSKSVSKPWPGFAYAMCNESMQALPWGEQCEIVGQAGYTGIEIAAFTLVKQGVSEISAAQRRDMVSAMQAHGLACAGLHWLLAPPPQGLHFTTPDVAVCKRTVGYLNELIDFSPGGKVIAEASIKVLKAIEAELV